jgi:translation initiation factor IF-3
MRQTACLFNASAALYRVFVAPIEQSQLQFARRPSPASLLKPRTAPKIFLSQQRRCYAAPAPAKRRLPRDDEIKAWSVSLVTDDGKLQEPRSTQAILEDMDRKNDSLVVVVPGEPGVPPICKIMNKQAMREAEKAKTKANRNPAATVKTIELNWAIDGNDLGHRLGKMREFLGKGFKVEVLLAGKKKGRKATEEEARNLLERLREVVTEVDGARESKPMEGKILAQAKFYAEGRAVQK